MDILKAEIARKRKLLEEKKVLVSKIYLCILVPVKVLIRSSYWNLLKRQHYILQDPTNNKKYFKRGELLAKEQEEYLKKYGPQKVEEKPVLEKKSEKG